MITPPDLRTPVCLVLDDVKMKSRRVLVTERKIIKMFSGCEEMCHVGRKVRWRRQGTNGAALGNFGLQLFTQNLPMLHRLPPQDTLQVPFCCKHELT